MKEEILKTISTYSIDQPSAILAYFYDQVLVGLYQDNDIIFSPDRDVDYNKLTKMHIFNEEKEIRIIVDVDKKKKSLEIKDKDNSIEEKMFLLQDGTYEEVGDFYKYTQNGKQVDLPKVFIKNPNKRTRLVVRNYFSDKVEFENYRLVRIESDGE